MLSFFYEMWDSLLIWLRIRPKSYRAVFAEDIPEKPEPTVVYIIGENLNHWCAVMKCPCGCHAMIQLNLLAQIRPSWTFREEFTGKLTLSPSIWRNTGCRSHFFVRDGRIIWCKNAYEF